MLSVILFKVIWTLEFVDVNPSVWPFDSFLFHSLFFACLQNCFPNLRLSHWTLDPGTFQNIFVPCCDNDYSIFKTNHHITSSESCEVDNQNTFFTLKRNINAVKEVPCGLLILLKNRVFFFSVRGRAGKNRAIRTLDRWPLAQSPIRTINDW